MSKRILQVAEGAYRATIEEQDDTVVWFTQAIKGGGADVTVLLRGHAVNYAVKGQDASGLAFGDRKQTQPPDLSGDLVRMIAKGVNVYAVSDDLVARGLDITRPHRRLDARHDGRDPRAARPLRSRVALVRTALLSASIGTAARVRQRRHA